MASKTKVKAAFIAMKGLGISEDKVKPVLKKLLKLYDKNWELIEEENYRALADAIFEDDDTKDDEEDTQTEELQRPFKRFRHQNEAHQQVASPGNSYLRIGGAALVQPKQEQELNPLEVILNEGVNGKQPVLSNTFSLTRRGNVSQSKDKGVTSEISPNEIHIKESNIFLGTVHISGQKRPFNNQMAVITPKDEPFSDEVPLDEAPLAVIHPEPSGRRISSINEENIGGENGDVQSALHVSEEPRDGGVLAHQTKNHYCEPGHYSTKSSTNLEIASSSLGECFLQSGKSCNGPGDKTIDVGSMQDDASHKPVMENDHSLGDNAENLPVRSLTSDRFNDSTTCVEKGIPSDSGQPIESTEIIQSEDSDLHRLRMWHRQRTRSVRHSRLKGYDITNGEERAGISWVNEINDRVPPSFSYTPHSIVFEGASISFSLAQIDSRNCCPSCRGDCLSATMPCACAFSNGGEFAYTVRGLLKESFLERCIARTREPTRRSYFHCQECPLEISEGGVHEACKGHLKRIFIKECWRKCGCNRHCGNRVVQRGISCRLQVFMTEGKGWGLRTLDELPKGAFVCEYIGEILTYKEAQMRNKNMTECGKMTYQAILDSGWHTASLTDEESLCLDTTFYANVARFINHRCTDANLIEIPVEVESPMRHYYHFAFFTTRKVQAMEEMTWDYGIDFEGDDHSSNMFQCLCGSNFCRSRKS